MNLHNNVNNARLCLWVNEQHFGHVSPTTALLKSYLCDFNNSITSTQTIQPSSTLHGQ